MSSLRLMFLGIWLTHLTGCSYIADLSLTAKSRRNAECAWKQEHRFYRESGMPYAIREHFGRGFVKGYEDVANGSNGTPPLFPPQCYWGSAYQSPAGDEKVRAWFNGYQEGALTALREGRAGTNELPTSWAPPGRVPHPVQIIPGEMVPPGTTDNTIVEPTSPPTTLRRPKPELDQSEPLPVTPNEDPKKTPKQEPIEIRKENPAAPTKPQLTTPVPVNPVPPKPAPTKPEPVKPGPLKTPSTPPAKGNSEAREQSTPKPATTVASLWRRAFMPRTADVSPSQATRLADHRTPIAEPLQSGPKTSTPRSPDVIQSYFFGAGFSTGGDEYSAENDISRPLFDPPAIIPEGHTTAKEHSPTAPQAVEVQTFEAAVPVVELRRLFDPPSLYDDFSELITPQPSEILPPPAPALRELFPDLDLGH